MTVSGPPRQMAASVGMNNESPRPPTPLPASASTNNRKRKRYPSRPFRTPSWDTMEVQTEPETRLHESTTAELPAQVNPTDSPSNRPYNKSQISSITRDDWPTRFYHHRPPLPPKFLPPQELHRSPAPTTIFQGRYSEDGVRVPSMPSIQLPLPEPNWRAPTVAIPGRESHHNGTPAQKPPPKQPAQRQPKGIPNLIWVPQMAPQILAESDHTPHPPLSQGHIHCMASTAPRRQQQRSQESTSQGPNSQLSNFYQRISGTFSNTQKYGRTDIYTREERDQIVAFFHELMTPSRHGTARL